MEIRQRIEPKPGELRCPRCLRSDIVPSLPRGIADMFMEGLGKIPRHCRSCGKRFYVARVLCGDAPASGEDHDSGQ